MRCREFRNQVADWVRTGDADHLEQLSRHAAACVECSRRLDEQRVLEGALERLRKVDEDEGASPAVEQGLLVEVRSARDQGRHPERIPVQPRTAWSRPQLVVALAAALFLGCGLVIWSVVSEFNRSTAVPVPEDQAKPVAPVAEQDNRAGGGQAVHEKKDSPRMKSAAPSTAGSALAAVSRREKDVKTPAVQPPVGRREPSTAADSGQTTAFIPVMPHHESESDYGLQLVRVELPRSTMTSFGLQVDRRQLDRPVKADLLIGPDGLTRAIRFVQ
jgi:hypothetical protein